MVERKFLTTSEAARYLGVGKSTLEKRRLTGGGPVYAKLGRTVIYIISDLDAWVASRRRRSTSELEAA